MIRVAALLSVTSLLLLKMPDASRIMALFAKFIDCLRFLLLLLVSVDVLEVFSQ